jgi:hypothetical protein
LRCSSLRHSPRVITALVSSVLMIGRSGWAA